MTDPHHRSRLSLFVVAAFAGLFAAATAQEAPETPPPAPAPPADPGLALFALRLSPPDPLVDPPQAALDAARVELAAGFALSERLARGREAGVFLTAPAPGPVVEGFGIRQAGGLRSQGLTFQAASGAQVRAPSGGDVLFAGPIDGLGEAVILQATPRAQVVLFGAFAVRV
ncbi:MAG: hypothetical protein ACKN9P_01440, partial [Phenylobacterium sp.]